MIEKKHKKKDRFEVVFLPKRPLVEALKSRKEKKKRSIALSI